MQFARIMLYKAGDAGREEEKNRAGDDRARPGRKGECVWAIAAAKRKNG